MGPLVTSYSICRCLLTQSFYQFKPPKIDLNSIAELWIGLVHRTDFNLSYKAKIGVCFSEVNWPLKTRAHYKRPIICHLLSAFITPKYTGALPFFPRISLFTLELGQCHEKFMVWVMCEHHPYMSTQESINRSQPIWYNFDIYNRQKLRSNCKFSLLSEFKSTVWA